MVLEASKTLPLPKKFAALNTKHHFHKCAVVFARKSGACDYYLAKGKGIVAVRAYKTNRLWVLQ
jgi:hypothetical protein